MLQSRIGYPIEYLACELEVSPRTIHRDLCLLGEAGIPVYYDANKRGYVLHNHVQVRTSDLSSEEITALLLAAHVCSLSFVGEFGQPIRQAISKLLAQMPSASREDIVGLLSSVEGKPSFNILPQGTPAVVAEILSALSRKRPIRIEYCSADEATPPLTTKITPQRLIAYRGNWYLVGQSSWHRKVFRFDLRHIRRVEQTEDSRNPEAAMRPRNRPPNSPALINDEAEYQLLRL